MGHEGSAGREPGSAPRRGREPRHVAVYGTLRLERVRRDLGLGGLLRPDGRCLLPGRLHDLGSYPGLVPDPTGVVVGELLVVDAPALERLDRYEDYRPQDPAGSLFRRVVLSCLDPAVPAWCYRYNRPPAGAPVIASGDWLAGQRTR